MKLTTAQVKEVCKVVAPGYGFKWELVYAVCLQEGQRSGNEFSPDVARLEQGYYRRYVEQQQELATSSEILLSASWGVMQMMGLSLLELEYFEWYFNQLTPGEKALYKAPRTNLAIANGLDKYATELGWMVEWGCKWLRKKMATTGGDVRKGLLKWNGGGNPEYDDEVMKKVELVEKGKL